MVTNRQITLCKEQIFSSSAAYQVPFYNRDSSKKEIIEKYKNLETSNVICISQPLGTGKTFLVDQLINEGVLEIKKGERFLTAKEVANKPDVLDKLQDATLVVDECDIKSEWSELEKALAILNDHLAESKKSAIVIGDFCMQNQKLASLLERKTYLENFESLNAGFFEGALVARIGKFLKDEVDIETFTIDKFIEPGLMRLLTPEWMSNGNSFRRVFSFLQVLASELPKNNNPCTFTLDMARDYERSQEVEFEEEQQEEFFQVFLEYIRERHPDGNGIGEGLFDETLFNLAREVGFQDMDEFRNVILEPYTRLEHFVSLGIPYYDDTSKKFICRPQPYVPSLKCMLRASKR